MIVDLLALVDWLQAFQNTYVALEGTAVYRHPVFNLLEREFTVILVNPQHIKAFPERKTDGKDSKWIADLLGHGLLRASFIPPQPIHVVRELVRYHKTPVQEQIQEVNRLHKIMEGDNIKPAAVAADVLVKSEWGILAALVVRTTDAVVLVNLAHGLLRQKLPKLEEALEGLMQLHHRTLLRHMLTHIDFLETTLGQPQDEIDTYLLSYQETMDFIQSISGIQATTVTTIAAEIGIDVNRFLSSKHIAPWEEVYPGNRQDDCWRMSGATTYRNSYLHAMLAKVVWAISRIKDNYLAVQYHRLAHQLGKKKAVTAVSYSFLIVIYHLLLTKKQYADLDANYLEKLNTDRVQQRHIHWLEQLGYIVTLSQDKFLSEEVIFVKKYRPESERGDTKQLIFKLDQIWMSR